MKKITVIIFTIISLTAGLIYSMIYMSYIKIDVSYQENTDQNSVVQPVKFGHANVYFIKTDTGHIMVDAGTKGDIKNLEQTFSLVDIQPNQVKLIIITHGHIDHIGELARAKEMTGASVLTHESIADTLGGGGFINPTPQTNFGKLLNFTTKIYTVFGGGKLENTTPDILVDNDYDLKDFGINGKVIYTPGHSQGSLSIILENGEALIGDIVRPDESGNLSLGMFYEDTNTIKNSLSKIIELDPTRLYLSHGEQISVDQLEEFYNQSL